MAGERIRKALKEFRRRYQSCRESEKTVVLNEFCQVTKYHRKYAISLLNKPAGTPEPTGKRRRGVMYSTKALAIVEHVWKSAGCPWSQRLKAMLPQWLPWLRPDEAALTPALEREILGISARQLDRRLKDKREERKKRIYGRTKPGTLLKHHIPLKTDCWDVTEPGYTEIDLVSHSGDTASGEFIYSLNVTDIHTGWVETRSVMGRGETGVVAALEEIRQALPFALKGIDSDNGSEFINHHLYEYCRKRHIQFTRGRPYKKDDNAHIEQKNWTHVRRVFGWDRYDTRPVMQAMNELYTHELRWMMNLYQPSVKLRDKKRVGARLRRYYDAPQTPLDRLIGGREWGQLPPALRRLVSQRQRLNPFTLSAAIETKLARIERLRKGDLRQANIVRLQQHTSPRGGVAPETPYAHAHTAQR